MNGKQKGFTLIEILVVVTIIGVLAGLVVVLIPRSQERARILQCTNNQRNFVGLMVSEDKGWSNSGPNLLLYFVKKGLVAKDNLQILFCPGDEANNVKNVGGEEAYNDLKLDTQSYGNLTSYAGRDQANTQCHVSKGASEPSIMTCDKKEEFHNKKGFVCGYSDGSVKFVDKVDDWNLDITTPVVPGDGSAAPALKCLKSE